jgi:hypothetical protein
MTNNISTKPLKHIAIIPDGNRRWAKNQGLSPQEGHRKAFIEVAPSLLKTLWDKEIYAATLWLFSTENWKRSDSEVDNLMDVFSQFLSYLLPLSGEYSVQLRHLGRKDRLPENLLSMVEEVEHSTKGMTGHECWMAGASEVVYSTLMMKNGFIAPNINFENPDEDSEKLNIVASTLEKKFNVYLSNSFGFGGTNSSLIIKDWIQP